MKISLRNIFGRYEKVTAKPADEQMWVSPIERIELERAPFLSLNDEQLVRTLYNLALSTQTYMISSWSIKRQEILDEMQIGLVIVEERIERDGLDMHPAFVPIVHELAAIPSSKLDDPDTDRYAIAIIDALKENPWRELIKTANTVKLNAAGSVPAGPAPA